MESAFNFQYILYIACVLICALIGLEVYTNLDQAARIVVCDVGNGDAIYIRTHSNSDIMVDFGSSADVLDCLGRNMPFMDRHIELALISHQHYDHYGGLSHVLRTYTIGEIIVPEGYRPAKSYDQALELARSMATTFTSLTEIIDSKVTYNFGKEEQLRCFWPGSRDLVAMTSDEKKDPNAYSHICIFAFGQVEVLLTGDATPLSLLAVEKSGVLDAYTSINILKVPHHGSRIGLTRDFLSYIQPELALISVGKSNSYGHPSPEVINTLSTLNVPTKLTAQDGDIRVNLYPDGTFSTQ